MLSSHACLACSAAPVPSPEPGPVTRDAWELVSLSEDPYRAHSASRIPCGSLAVTPGQGGVEVSTETCNYATLVHRTMRPMHKGQQLVGELSWLSLASLEPTAGTLALRLGEHELWSLEVEIPTGARIVSVSVAILRDTAAGSDLYFHVRNHGYNSWHMGRLDLEDSRTGNQ